MCSSSRPSYYSFMEVRTWLVAGQSVFLHLEQSLHLCSVPLASPRTGLNPPCVHVVSTFSHLLVLCVRCALHVFSCTVVLYVLSVLNELRFQGLYFCVLFYNTSRNTERTDKQKKTKERDDFRQRESRLQLSLSKIGMLIYSCPTANLAMSYSVYEVQKKKRIPYIPVLHQSPTSDMSRVETDVVLNF